MKKTLRTLAQRTLLAPPHVEHCSQTVYQTLLGCCRMFQATQSQVWRQRADDAVALLMRIQRPDGGFDIGYEFDFGYLHKKGDSTSPELVGLTALCEYARLFGPDRVAQAAQKAADWIRRFAMRLPDGKAAIAYSPYTINEVMVYNGTSFACGALGSYLGQFGGDDELWEIYSGMVSYLDSVMSTSEDLPGRFWYYADQSRQDIDALKSGKIDYYHQMQQVETHALAQQVAPLPVQAGMIRDAADHIVALHDKEGGPVPYTNSPKFFKNQIHVWGMSSIASGLLEAAAVHPDRSGDYQRVAMDVIEWIVAHSWNGDFFNPVLTREGHCVKPGSYMVRSDAWVFGAIAAASRFKPCETYSDIAHTCYDRMLKADFSGPESHASTLRTRWVAHSIQRALSLLARRKP